MADKTYLDPAAYNAGLATARAAGQESFFTNAYRTSYPSGTLQPVGGPSGGKGFSFGGLSGGGSGDVLANVDGLDNNYTVNQDVKNTAPAGRKTDWMMIATWLGVALAWWGLMKGKK